MFFNSSHINIQPNYCSLHYSFSSSSPILMGCLFRHMSSSPAQWQSSVQTRLCCLHEHRPEHVRSLDAHLQRVNSKTAYGAGASLISTGTSRPSCCCHLSSRGFGMTGFKTISCEQPLVCTCTRLMCSNHAPWVGGSLSTPLSGFNRLKRFHMWSFDWVTWNRL